MKNVLESIVYSIIRGIVAFVVSLVILAISRTDKCLTLTLGYTITYFVGSFLGYLGGSNFIALASRKARYTTILVPSVIILLALISKGNSMLGTPLLFGMAMNQAIREGLENIISMEEDDE